MTVRQPLVSIILPVYNGEEFLARSLESCLNQTHRNLELIIVDDCSSDTSYEIARSYAKKDSRIRILRNDINKKLPASLNIGHKVANGDFFTWTSDDNFYELNAIEYLLKEFSEEDPDLVYSNFNLIDSQEQIIFNYFKSDSPSILFGNIVGSCFLYKRELYERNKGYDEEFHTIEDYDFWLRASTHSTFKFTPRILYNYRFHERSLTSQVKFGNGELLTSFESKLESAYRKFFSRFSIENDYYPNFFKDLYLHKELDVERFMSQFSKFTQDLSPVFDKYGKCGILETIDIKLRSNILRFKRNQKIKNLVLITRKHPGLLLKYNKRRSLEIILKCFTRI